MTDPVGLSPEQRRAAEERLLARYEQMLMKTMEIPSDRRSGPRRYDPIWPLEDGRIRSTEAFQGIFVEDARIERSYPDTVMVIVFRFFLRPECLYGVAKGLWTLQHLLEPEPWFNDVFITNLGEWLACDFKYQQLECRSDKPVIANSPGTWSQTLPRLASGEIPCTAEDRQLAIRAMDALGLSK